MQFTFRISPPSLPRLSVKELDFPSKEIQFLSKFDIERNLTLIEENFGTGNLY